MNCVPRGEVPSWAPGRWPGSREVGGSQRLPPGVTTCLWCQASLEALPGPRAGLHFSIFLTSLTLGGGWTFPQVPAWEFSKTPVDKIPMSPRKRRVGPGHVPRHRGEWSRARPKG